MKKIINNILHRFKEDLLSKRKGLVDRTVMYKSLKELKTCLVFWTAGSDIQSYSKALKNNLQEVKLDQLCYVPAGAEMLETDNIVTLRDEDLGFGGKIQNERLYTVLANEYDLLIDLTVKCNTMVRYVLTNNHACCIVGMKREGEKADILVDGVESPIDFIEKLRGLLADIKRY